MPFSRKTSVFCSLICCLLAVSGISCVSGAGGKSTEEQTITLGSLLDEMVNRDKITYVSDPEFVVKQFSSYDRRSKVPNPEDGKKIVPKRRVGDYGWFANGDASNFLRREKKNGRVECVMMDVKGPGCIVRMWNALSGAYWSKKPKLRIYIDNSPKPVIVMDTKDIIGGRGFVGKPFSYTTSLDEPNGMWRGRNLFFPIPFGKSCKVTIEQARGGYYYQINYRKYAKNVKIESYTESSLKKYKKQISAAKMALNKDIELPGECGKRVIKNQNARLAAGEACKFVLEGRGQAIQEFSFKIDADDLMQALRSTVIEIAFDGNKTVWVPVGAFFGIGYGLEKNNTFYIEADNNNGYMSFKSKWVMPFKRNALITLHNYGKQTVYVENFDVRAKTYNWTKRSMYFHGTWFELRKFSTKIRRDINFVTIKGQGKYVGDSLTIYNTSIDWWGEGDEKIYVDGESFPSHFGTGTEDYYCYAWCRPQRFYRPFHAQPRGEGNKDPGFSTNDRYRSLDAIPFKKSIKFDMELWHPFRTLTNYAPSTFFYARPGAVVNIKPSPASVKFPVAKCSSDVTGKKKK